MAESLSVINQLLNKVNDKPQNPESASKEFLDNQQYTKNGILRYEKIFGKHFVSVGGIRTTKEFVDKYLNLKKGQSVLDVGCGIGGSAFYMAQQHSVDVLGIDLSTNMLQIANERLQEEKSNFAANVSVSFELSDATKRNFPENSFDVVYSRDTILHIYDKLTLFKCFFKWLKPGGTLFITDYCCGDRPHSDAFKEYVKSRQYHLHTPAEYSQMIEKAGFVDVDGSDATDEFCNALQYELDGAQQIKSDFVTQFSQKDYDYIVNGWKAKLVRCSDGDQKWGKFCARKPSLQWQSESKEDDSDKPRVFFVLGGPGAGKGTQCSNLVKEFGLIHLSAGDLLRAERNSGSTDAQLINNYIREGKIVPVQITVGLIKKAMQKYMRLGQSNFVIDGFPRNEDNLNGWNTLMSDFAKVPFLLFLDCDEERMTQRIMKRAELSAIKRKDDNLETLQKRFRVFKQSTMPIIERFTQRSKCVTVASIDTEDNVYSKVRRPFIKHLMKPKVIFVLGGPGAGKGTQCDRLVKDEAFTPCTAHLSAGDLLRKERNSGSAHAELINNCIADGKIVPVAITVGLIKKAMHELIEEEGKYVFVIDGFPRNFDNYNGWQQVMRDACEVEFLLLLECTEEEMTKRILNRAQQSQIKRKDDNKETLKKRFKVFYESTQPVIQVYEEQNKVMKVQSIGSVDDIYDRIRALFVPFVKKPSVIFVLGGPGAGKGTQCTNLVNEFGCIHLSAGDLLRAERNSGSPDAELINNYIAEGKIVPVEITVSLIKRAMLKRMREDNKYLFVIDGFPRNYDNLSGWNRICGGHFANVPFLLHLQCSEDEMTKRILDRAKKSKTKRKDDNIETIKKRFKVYNESTMSVVNVYRKEGKCVEIDAMDTIDNVYSKLQKVFVEQLNL